MAAFLLGLSGGEGWFCLGTATDDFASYKRNQTRGGGLYKMQSDAEVNGSFRSGLDCYKHAEDQSSAERDVQYSICPSPLGGVG